MLYLTKYNSNNEMIELQTFIENGKRAWDGIYNGNASDKFGIYPVNNNTEIPPTETNQNPITKIWKKLWN